jgi:hypothetical protein
LKWKEKTLTTLPYIIITKQKKTKKRWTQFQVNKG